MYCPYLRGFKDYDNIITTIKIRAPLCKSRRITFTIRRALTFIYHQQRTGANTAAPRPELILETININDVWTVLYFKID